MNDDIEANDETNMTPLCRFNRIVKSEAKKRVDEGIGNEKTLSEFDYLQLENLECIHQKVRKEIDEHNDNDNDPTRNAVRHLYYRKLAYDSYGLMVDVVDPRIKLGIKKAINKAEIHVLAKNIKILQLDDEKLKKLKYLDEYNKNEGWILFYSNCLIDQLLEFRIEAETTLRRLIMLYQMRLPVHRQWDKLKFPHVYDNLVLAIHYAFFIRVTNYSLIVSCLRLLLASPNKSQTFQVMLINEDPKFLAYFLNAARSQRFNISSYERSFVNFEAITYSKEEYGAFSQLFSLLDVYTRGKYDRAFVLLQYGCEIFTNDYIVAKEKALFQRLKRLYYLNQITKGIFITLVAMLFYGGDDNDRKNQRLIFFLIWKTLPEPYPTKRSIVRALSRVDLILPLHVLKQLNVFIEVCALYFEDYAHDNYKPRSLKHLVSCSIRKTLKENFFLPTSIDELNIPNTLKKYLNLKEEN